LVRLQNEFVRHWLFYGDDPEAQGEAEALRARELSMRGQHAGGATEQVPHWRCGVAP